VSYTVTALKPTLQVQEAATGSGGICGSMFLDCVFVKYMYDRFGDNPRLCDDVVKEAMEQFDTEVKRGWDGDLNQQYFIRCYGLADGRQSGVQRDGFHLSGANIRDIFEPVISEILRLVVNQILATKKTVTAILLVGGFSNNIYLHQRLQAEVGRLIQVKKVMNRCVLAAYVPEEGKYIF
jgi:hypothetical protein